MKKYFFIGIKGKGMLSLSKFLHDEGNIIEGYDANILHDNLYKKLNELGIKFHDKLNKHILDNTIILLTSAISKKKLLSMGLLSDTKEVYYYHEYVAILTKKYKTICVSGSFGKTTTASALALIFNENIGCNYLVGDGSGHYNSKNKYLILEACEFDRHFLNYSGESAILTNIGFEHTDCYKNINEIVSTFEKFLNKINGLKLIYGDNEYVNKENFNGEVLYYGFNSDNDVLISNVKYEANGITFKLKMYDGNYHDFKLKIYGEHILLDIVAAITLSYYYGCSLEDIKKSLKNYKSPKYRFVESKKDDIHIISDYCGHYSGIKNNILAVRQKYPGKKINVIFEPISYVRAKNTFSLICNALKLADFAYICDLVPLRETKKQFNEISAYKFIESISNSRYYSKDEYIYFNQDDVVLILCPQNASTIMSKIKNVKNKPLDK